MQLTFLEAMVIILEAIINLAYKIQAMIMSFENFYMYSHIYINIYDILIGNFLATCHLPPEVGSCKGRFPRWFFNTSSSQCELFIYGGCHGNKNQFGTLNECIDLCGELYIVAI